MKKKSFCFQLRAEPGWGVKERFLRDGSKRHWFPAGLAVIKTFFLGLSMTSLQGGPKRKPLILYLLLIMHYNSTIFFFHRDLKAKKLKVEHRNLFTKATGLEALPFTSGGMLICSCRSSKAGLTSTMSSLSKIQVIMIFKMCSSSPQLETPGCAVTCA